jgi:anaerobic magnesium-protoporphyrin IX monomethyl ester cyclase
MATPRPLPIAAAAPGSSRDTRRPVVLVGFQDQGNLGLGYLAAVLEQHGYRVMIFDFESDTEQMLRSIRELDPLLVGFSLIFQFYIHRFETLINRLRQGGVRCHFTMGGHFPSLSWERTLELVPALDSVVVFEGELTLLELVDRLGSGQDWRDVHGVAWVRDGAAVCNPLRPLLRDLDLLPWPRRDQEPESILGQKALPLLASRGCARTCSFCSIHRFYRTAPGKVVRTRQPQKVVQEMRAMHEERGITIFLFQDDDFPLFGPVWHRWTREFLDELHRAGLPGRAIWKINCRADAVERELFRDMRDAGLYLVYIGLESGTEGGLDTLAKGITVEQNLAAVALVKELRLMLEFGFMMFDPSSTFESVRANVDFLRRIVGDGSAAAVFCRMLPYDGTPIKSQLEAEGRLRGDVVDPDYDFLDPRIGTLYEDISRLVHVAGWIHGYQALSPQINWAWNELAIMDRLFPALHGRVGYETELRAITRESNELLFGVVEELAVSHETGRSSTVSAGALQARAAAFLQRLQHRRDDFVLHNQDTLLETLQLAV